ncbi:transcriptional regulator LytR [Halobacillus andaensis]|uniref:Transcriptional regulator LytR n=1 Tax=Halobacillus andaensis TaxID=1176239 RepID=A0A917F0J0_HALAA|nr:LCP family protein [Halobacillus andaensis]MBP2005339.1 LCP family protein required for cell wall assembly [Halobacillus andaensis]GGF30717.1 transcriptional regulator LytR [Halobacillus andaensis]
MATRSMKHRRKKKKTWLLSTLAIVLLLAGGGAAYLYSMYNNVKTTVDDDIHEEVSGIDDEAAKEKVEEEEPINVLLLGVDERDNDTGRADTMIVLSLDPANNRMQMVSIPRDTRTEISGEGTTDKINHSYAYGGSEMAVNTVEDFLDIDLDYYVRMNMDGLSQMVDAVGGIEVSNDQSFSQGGYDFKEGNIELNGDEALAYVRMRKDDPEGDAGRNDRQREVIQGTIDQGANANIANNIDDMMDVLGNNAATNMKFEDMRNLATNYRSARHDMETYQMEGEDTYINDIYYLDVPESEIEKTRDKINEYTPS